ncbi:MAG: alkaline phosphatase family protein, partial [Acetobacteraceae bacterium]
LRPASAEFDGLAGNESNPFTGADGRAIRVPAANLPGLDSAALTVPNPDPGELFAPDINEQLFFPEPAASERTPTMAGFVTNYARQPGVTAANAGAVMHYFTPGQVPVLSGLADAFAVSDRWHAAAPCQTWPNRFFVHTATANGYVNNSPPHFPYTMPTLYGLLDAGGRDWRIYFHDVPHSLTLASLWPRIERFARFGATFARDAAAGRLPAYSFIEPRYFSDPILGLLPNDQHPPHNIALGEALIAEVYNALRAGPHWPRTLLVITYDEHGGCFDHVPPPRATPPGPPYPDGFTFDRFGVRVPAVLVSPWVAPGALLRPVGAVPFDHTSIIRTVREIFDLGPPLTARDAAAPSLLPALSLSAPTNAGPASMAAPAYAPAGADLARALAAVPNDIQRALGALAAHLPADAAGIGAQLAALSDGSLVPPIPAFESVEDTFHFVTERLSRLV